jgi:sec-independent protein translocase protein TatC
MKRLLFLVTAPFRATARWWRNLTSGFKRFFSEEPEDAPLGETLTKTFENPTGLLEHVDILRRHLLRSALVFAAATGVAILYNQYILDFLMRPLPEGSDMVAIDVTEPLSTVMKVSLLAGFAVALPYITFEVYLFLAPGLHANTRKWSLLAIPAVLILFVTGLAFAFFVMLPPALNWLLNVGEMATQVRPSSYFGFISRVLFWVGIVFEFPLIVFILASMGLVSSKLLLQNWRIAVIVIAVIAALITPTIDPFNMLIIMGPMIVLYFLSIGLAVFAQKRRSASNPA